MRFAISIPQDVTDGAFNRAFNPDRLRAYLQRAEDSARLPRLHHKAEIWAAASAFPDSSSFLPALVSRASGETQLR